MDMSGIEPDPSRMLSERDNQLHHMPLYVSAPLSSPYSKNAFKSQSFLAAETKQCSVTTTISYIDSESSQSKVR